MLWNMSHQTITIKDWCVVIDVLRPNADLGITSERRLERVRLIMGKNVEIPDGSASWLVAVKWSCQADFSRVLVDDKCSIVGELSCQAVADVRITIYVGISCSHLHSNG